MKYQQQQNRMQVSFIKMEYNEEMVCVLQSYNTPFIMCFVNCIQKEE